MVARKANYLRHLTDVKTPDRNLAWSVPNAGGRHLWRDGQLHDQKALARAPRK
jgi:hypothetical protein